MIRALRAGAEYFGLVFAAGLLLGTARAFLLQPLLGATMAVVVELPMMLAVAWAACALVIRHSRVSTHIGERAVMGLAAFALLLLAEAALSLLLGRTLGEHLSLYYKADAQLGLIAQIAFAAFPAIRKNAGVLS